MFPLTKTGSRTKFGPRLRMPASTSEQISQLFGTSITVIPHSRNCEKASTSKGLSDRLSRWMDIAQTNKCFFRHLFVIAF